MNRCKFVAPTLLLGLSTNAAIGQDVTPEMIYFPHVGELRAYVPDPDAVPTHVLTTGGAIAGGGPTLTAEFMDSGSGFDDPVLGATRRDTAIAVLDYVSSVLNDTGAAVIRFEVSQFDGMGALASAGSLLPGVPVPVPPGGACLTPHVLSHITTGVDPNPSAPDGECTVDFGYNWNNGLDAPGPGEFDLFTVLLHEVTHALGFASSTDDAAGESFFVVGDVSVRLGGLDPWFVIAATGDPMIDCPDGTFLGGAPLEGGSCVGSMCNCSSPPDGEADRAMLSGPAIDVAWTDVGGTGFGPPIYTPNPWQNGSSMSHWDCTDAVIAGLDLVMPPSVSSNVMVREYHPLELAVLDDLGYTVGDFVPSGACCFGDGSCADGLTMSDCSTMSGEFLGNGTTCGMSKCELPIVNDECTGAIAINCGDIVSGSTVDADPDVAPLCGTSDGTAGGVWYTYEGDGAMVTMSTCSPGTNYDTKIRVYEGSCGGLICVAGNDDDCGVQSTVTWESSPGTSYFILVHGFSDFAGDFELTTTCEAVPSGACCLADGSCEDDLTATDCAGLEGDFQGESSTCGAIKCALPIANDECTGAIAITCGDLVAGSTVDADADVSPFCDTGDGTGGGVWYIYDGDGAVVTVTTCSPETDYDTKIRVYEGTCEGLICVAGNDDDCGVQSSVTWESNPTTSYFILVHGFSGFAGDFELSTTCDGEPDCPGDTNGDLIVDVADLVNVILAWGTADPSADINDDGTVDVADLVAIILGWGVCEDGGGRG